KWLTQVQIALRPLKIYQNIDFWDDTRIKVGSQWRSEIKDAIERAEIVILLVSKEFLASEFIANNELPPLMKAVKRRGKLIIPIILNHVFLPPSLGLDEFQSLIPNPIDQNPWAHWRSPMDMMRQGWSTSLFHAAQQWSTRSS